MTRILFSVLLMMAFITHGNIVRAEDAPAADAAAVEAPAAEAAPEKAAEEKTPEVKTPDATTHEEKPAEEAEVPKELQEHQKAAQDVFELTKKIAGNLAPEEQRHFFLIYNNYNMIGTVKMVRGDVANAVEGCGKENPEMKTSLDADFKKWLDEVDPVTKEAEINIDNMVLAQDYAKPDDIKKVFKGLDKTRTLANKQIEKTPVTTKDACEYLQGKMTDTKENFIKLLRSTLVSAPVAFPGNSPDDKKTEVAPEEPKKDEAAQEEVKTEEKAADAPAEKAEEKKE